MNDTVSPAQRQLPYQQHPTGSVGEPRGATEHVASRGDSAQLPTAAPGAANGRAPSRGRRGLSRGQRPPVASAAAAAERALADLQPRAADAVHSQAPASQARRPPRPASRLHASAPAFVPDAADASGQHQRGHDTQHGNRQRPPRQRQRSHAADVPGGAALSDAQASAARALAVSAQPQQRRRQRPGRGGSATQMRHRPPRPDSGPAADGSDSAAQTSDDQTDDYCCPICTDRLVVRARTWLWEISHQPQ